MADLTFPPIVHSEGVAIAVQEASYLEDPAPTPVPATDAFFCYDVSIQPEMDSAHLRFLAPYAGTKFSVKGAKFTSISFKVPLAGAGNDATTGLNRPVWFDVIEACQWAATSTGTSPITQWDLNPVTQQVKSCYLDFYFHAADADSLKYSIRGCMGQAKLVLDIDNIYGYWEFTMEGIYVTPADSAVVTPSYTNEQSPPSLEGITCTFDTNTVLMPYLEIINGTQIASGKSLSGGVEGYVYKLARRTEVTGTMRTQALREGAGAGEYDWWATVEASDTKVVTVAAIGSATGNTWAVGIPVAVIDAPRISESDQIQMLEFPISAHWNGASTGDNEVTVVLT